MGEQFFNNFYIGFSVCLGALTALVLLILVVNCFKKFTYDPEYWWHNGKKPRWNDD